MKVTSKKLNNFVKEFGYELTAFAGVNPAVSHVFFKKENGQAFVGKPDSISVIVNVTKKERRVYFLQKIHKYLTALERLIADADKRSDIRIAAKVEGDKLVPYKKKEKKKGV